MPEAVRLVIWDLDDTFWRGTVTEGGIREYVQSHHDIVISLAQRGIMSSICSKNDEKTIRNILIDKKIDEYFIFPSISWEAKGTRIASTIKAVGLRPETVMFIDDNPGNRAEVASVIPGIQVQDEHFIATMLDHELFRGKDDRALSRLQQYKILEKRRTDENRAGSNNSEFLKNSNIKVSIKEVDSHSFPRAIELVNRTNQLNFTKKRIEPTAEAESAFMDEIALPDRRCGIVSVTDNYGDYGDIGFFMVQLGAQRHELIHFCYSCRTLGMEVESWVYEWLGRPALSVVGEVLTDLTVEKPIDWITLVDEQQEQEGRLKKDIGLLRMVGGCEANAISPYLEQKAETVKVEANFAVGPMLVRVNSSGMLLSATKRQTSEFALEMERLGIPSDKMHTEFFDEVPTGSVLVLSLQLDSGYTSYHHRTHEWDIKIEPDSYWGDLTDPDPKPFEDYLAARKFEPQQTETFRRIAEHMRVNYKSVRGPDPHTLTSNMERVFDKVPLGAKMVVIAPGEVVRSGGKICKLHWIPSYNKRLAAMCETIPYVGIVSIDDLITSEDEIAEGWNHYERSAYLKIALAIVDLSRTIPVKAS